MAAIGQTCAGLAHESRNALQRSQACLEMLALKLVDRPDTLGLISRVQQAQDDLHRLYEDVREYAAPIKLVLRDCDLAEIWRRAWSHLEPLREGRQATLHEPHCGLNLTCQADPFRLEQVFRNILDNALSARDDGVDIAITGSAARLDGRAAICLAIRDNGPGLTPEQHDKIFEIVLYYEDPRDRLGYGHRQANHRGPRRPRRGRRDRGTGSRDHLDLAQATRTLAHGPSPPDRCGRR